MKSDVLAPAMYLELLEESLEILRAKHPKIYYTCGMHPRSSLTFAEFHARLKGGREGKRQKTDRREDI